MIPILYSETETDFTANGLGSLIDCVSCKCTEKLNDGYEIDLEIPYFGKHVDKISTDRVIKVRSNYEDPPQLFRIYSISKKYDGNISVKAAHISYDTVGIPILPFTAQNLTEAVENMNTNRKLLTPSAFVLNCNFSAEGTLEVTSPTPFRSLLGGSDDSIIEVYGGDYHYDNFTINLVEKRGHNRGLCFRYGKNILDFEDEVSSEELYSAVLGYWKRTSSSSSSFVYGNIIQCEGTFPYDKIYILEVSNGDLNISGSSTPTEEQIDEYVQKYISEKEVGIPKHTMTIDYRDDNNIINVCLGDIVGVSYPQYNISTLARCNTVVFDCLNERNESIEIGVESKDISDSIVELLNKKEGN